VPVAQLGFDFSLKNKQRNFNEFKGGGIKNMSLSPKPNPHSPAYYVSDQNHTLFIKKTARAGNNSQKPLS
jgi:hypothetical protein